MTDEKLEDMLDIEEKKYEFCIKSMKFTDALVDYIKEVDKTDNLKDQGVHISTLLMDMYVAKELTCKEKGLVGTEFKIPFLNGGFFGIDITLNSKTIYFSSMIKTNGKEIYPEGPTAQIQIKLGQAYLTKKTIMDTYWEYTKLKYESTNMYSDPQVVKLDEQIVLLVHEDLPEPHHLFKSGGKLKFTVYNNPEPQTVALIKG